MISSAGLYEEARVVMARRLSQSTCREEAYAHGSVHEIGIAANHQEFTLIRSVAELTANMCDGNEVLDVWTEEAP